VFESCFYGVCPEHGEVLFLLGPSFFNKNTTGWNALKCNSSWDGALQLIKIDVSLDCFLELIGEWKRSSNSV
jgi:hypothetical protein